MKDLKSEAEGTPEILCIPETRDGTTRMLYASAI
jgi:hypothetical protein